MQRKKRVWAAVAVIMIPIDGAIGRLHSIGPNPGTFFPLGALETLSVLGVAYGLWDARRVVRSGQPICN